MELEDRTRTTHPLIVNSTQNGAQLSPETLAIIARSRLVISPDLDALLEHEDRSRAQQIVTVTELKTREAQFPLGAESSTSQSPAGLPPPPRRTRQGRHSYTAEGGQRRTDSVTSEPKDIAMAQDDQEVLTNVPKSPVHSLSSSISNPYINPAPNLQEIFLSAVDRMTPDEADHPYTSTTTNGTAETLQPYDPRLDFPVKDAAQEDSRRQDSRPRDEPSPKTSSQDVILKQQSASRLGIGTVVPRVDKLKLLSKISLSNSGDTRSSSQNVEHGPSPGYSPSTTTSPKRPNLLTRGNNKGKAIKEKAVDPRTLMDAGRIHDEVEVPTWRKHRPLLSHGQQSSISSIESFNSYGPPSTAENEPRISISSTIYPESSNSFTPSIYNNPSPAFDMNPYHHDSFMEINSPNNLDQDFEQQQRQHERQSRPSIDSQQETNLSPIEFTHTPISGHSTLSFDAPKTARTYGVKPPVPSAPKPLFSRTGLRLSRHSSPKGSSSSQPDSDQGFQLPVRPLTTNFLDLEERADLVRKSRKLARVFGQTPDGDIIAQQDSGRTIHVNIPGKAVPGDHTRLLTGIRRHSMPLSPDDISFLSIVSPTKETSPTLPERIIEIRGVAEPVSLNDDTMHQEDLTPIRSSPPASFIDLSEDITDKTASRKTRHSRSVSQSTFDTTTTSLLEGDEDRRRKRERLAKLHRFLGSRVPIGLVLGIDDAEASLPPPLSPPVSKNPSSEEEVSKKAWLSRRRSSSTTSLLPVLDDMDRLRVELDDREKAINVRRAQKMEKVFGVAPPQTLYHTRHSASPSASLTRPTTERVAGFVPPASEAELNTFQRNPNRSSYIKSKPKKNNRPGTSESNKQLISQDSPFSNFDDRFTDNHTLIYSHYQHSLNSLNDIIDRDDRESLAELHQYLHGAEPTSPPVAFSIHRKLSNASVKPERRRSLPARTSMISLASEFTVAPAKADPTAFQMRRRRAAKLTQFFGVDYRELISDVLDSIENGVEQEHQRGTLRAEEVEDLLDRLRNLKTKRQSFI